MLNSDTVLLGHREEELPVKPWTRSQEEAANPSRLPGREGPGELLKALPPV